MDIFFLVLPAVVVFANYVLADLRPANLRAAVAPARRGC